ncbi:MAG: hypothetical protein KAY24_11015 [Candidatus Eisenbacteria sp.]|nr:hypothetical protein [Candidatus Eisenbacteria bacterium]
MKTTHVQRVLRCTVLLSLLLFPQIIAPQGAAAQELTIKAHIPWGWIHDFEFYNDGIFVAPHNGGISYFHIEEDFALTYRYTICPGGSHVLAQFCVADSYLFALDGAAMHQSGTPVFFAYSISEFGSTFLAGLEPSGTIWAQFDPITYHKGYVIYQEYPADYYRIDVSDPTDPFVTGTLMGATDVCLDIVPYQDSLFVATMQRGTGYWDGNFRLILGEESGGLTSVGTYGTGSYSYTSGAAIIESVLFTSHGDGLRVYDLSDLGNVPQIYFYPAYWGRCIRCVDDYIYMGSNDGWHLFRYVSTYDIQFLDFLPNGRRVLRMRPKPEEQELWCFVDGGVLGGLVVLEAPSTQAVGDNASGTDSAQIKLQGLPNPFVSQTVLRYSVPFDAQATLGIYDSAGKLVRTLLSGSTTRGCHGIVWTGADDRGNSVSTGIYFCRLDIGGLTTASKVIRLD